MRLTLKELREAVKDWCDKRGIVVEPGNITFGEYVMDNVNQMCATLLKVDVPPKEGPYR